MKDKIVVGLDIGTTKVCAIVGRKNEFGKIDILGVGQALSTGVSRGMVSNIPRTEEAIRQAILEAQNRSGIEIKVVHVGIAGEHIKSTPNRSILIRSNIDTEIAQDDLDRLADDMYRIALPPGEQIIHVIPQDYTIDGSLVEKNPIGIAGLRIEGNFHVITGQIGPAKNIYKCVTRAGLHVDSLILEPLASSDAVLNEEELEAGVALVDIGGGTTDIAIFHDGVIRHTAIIPFGGNVITTDIQEGCMVMKKQAELLKIKFGSAIPEENKENEIISVPNLPGKEPKEISVKNLSRIIHARMEEIISSVHYEIKASGLEKKLIAGIVLTGGGSQLKHLPQLVEYMTGLDVRVGYPDEHLAKGMVNEVKSPAFATGIGLLMKGLSSNISQGNYSAEKPSAEMDSIIPEASEVTVAKEKPKAPSLFSKLANTFHQLMNDEEMQDFQKDKEK
ncbi:MAG: cell division protein FtsA [Bacteroidetes bacterium]|nr:cell division protein FtsA [Bacteroidota bacterium]